MGIFHRPDHFGAPIAIGALVFSLGLSAMINQNAVFSSKPESQKIVTAAQLMGTSSMTPQQIEQARRDRCTPGFSCGASTPVYTRVSKREALKFAFTMGQGVNR